MEYSQSSSVYLVFADVRVVDVLGLVRVRQTGVDVELKFAIEMLAWKENIARY